MNLYAVLIYDSTHKLLYEKYNWDQFTTMEKMAIGIGMGTMKDITQNLIKRSTENQHYNILEQVGERKLSIWISSFGGHQIIITNPAYPKRIALQFLRTLNTDKPIGDDLEKLFKYYVNPPKVDTIIQIRDELEDTKVIMLDNIEFLLSRQESIDDLLIKSNQMVNSSEDFAISAKRLNSCCVII